MNLLCSKKKKGYEEEEKKTWVTRFSHKIWARENVMSVRSVPGKYLGKVGQNPSDSKSNRLHVDVFWFCFHSFEVYTIYFCKIIAKFPKVLNFNRLFLKPDKFICN